MIIVKAHAHFIDMLQKLRTMEASPWPFLCAATMIDYLSKMASENGGKWAYIEFIRKYMNQDYSNFQFANGDKDLPEQLYHILRCGVVHSFSLTPELKHYPKGRNESIIIGHAGRHLTAYSGVDGHHTDAVCLVFQDFANDVGAALTKLFSDARTDAKLRAFIQNHLEKNPPVVGLEPTVVPLTFLGSNFSTVVSGSTHL